MSGCEQPTEPGLLSDPFDKAMRGQGEAQADLDRLQGTWVMVDVRDVDGKEVPESIGLEYVFERDRFSISGSSWTQYDCTLFLCSSGPVFDAIANPGHGVEKSRTYLPRSADIPRLAR
jgi:hypothetical protein